MKECLASFQPNQKIRKISKSNKRRCSLVKECSGFCFAAPFGLLDVVSHCKMKTRGNIKQRCDLGKETQQKGEKINYANLSSKLCWLSCCCCLTLFIPRLSSIQFRPIIFKSLAFSGGFCCSVLDC